MPCLLPTLAAHGGHRAALYGKTPHFSYEIIKRKAIGNWDIKFERMEIRFAVTAVFTVVCTCGNIGGLSILLCIAESFYLLYLHRRTKAI